MRKRKKLEAKKRGKSGSVSVVLPRIIGEPSAFEFKYARSRITEFAHKNRKNLTLAEERFEAVLNRLRDGSLKGAFKSQYVISGKWIVDFFLPKIRLAIEIDGSSHDAEDQKAKDYEKEYDCGRFDITLIRFRNSDVFGDEEVLASKFENGWKEAETRKNKIIGRPFSSIVFDERPASCVGLAIMSSNVTPYVQCECGHELSGFKILDSQGRFEPGIPPDPDKVRKLLPRLKCKVCGVKGKARLILKPSVVGPSLQLLATARSLDQVFHRSTCGWIKNVRADDEISFANAADAIRRGYQPCTYCCPK
jgi:very-short-patch-repair endonuclease